MIRRNEAGADFFSPKTVNICSLLFICSSFELIFFTDTSHYSYYAFNGTMWYNCIILLNQILQLSSKPYKYEVLALLSNIPPVPERGLEISKTQSV